MKELYENLPPREKAILIGVDTGEYDAEVSIDELGELARTAGAQVVMKVIQRRGRPEAATYVGRGKLGEIISFSEFNGADTLIFDNELSPSQQKTLEIITGKKIIDRTTLILDIFAQRARSNEGKLQTELAQLKYSLPRLHGMGAQMSRLGGGIGTRGPGETKLETDRRHILRRIKSLENELNEVDKRRKLHRDRRKKTGTQTVAIVGYTNAGKSTLMNYLTNAGILAEDKLFATLDPTSRALKLPDGRKIMLIDTVGLVRRLPHQLVDAFKSTLQEAADATVILNVCDASDENCAEHLDVTRKLLEELDCLDKPIISVMNKCDKISTGFMIPTFGKTVMISALTGEGVDLLLKEITACLPPDRQKAELLIPFANGEAAAVIRKNGSVISEEYTPEGLKMTAVVETGVLEKYKNMVISIGG